jgi:acetylornithine deacetylase/succinyl-diaminopimelate desuccinylase-like protein
MIDEDRAVALLKGLIRCDTSNPPGNEEVAALFLEDVLKREGFVPQISMAAPKRVNLVARLEGRHPGKPVVLLSHIDVVPARAEEWDLPPFGGEEQQGFIYGRGAIDMKSQTICQLLAFIQLRKDGIVPESDILFVASCDEEVGGEYGVKHLLEEHEDLRNASFVLSEGGFLVEENGAVHAQVSVTEKRLSQFKIRARGKGGHGSMPHGDNANEKVVRAAARILACDWPMKPTRVVEAYMEGLLKGRQIGKRPFDNLKNALLDPAFVDFVKAAPVLNALLRNTVTLTILKGGTKVNVIPGESEASFDARLLPTEGSDTFFRKIARLCGKDVEIEPITTSLHEPAPSGYNSLYFRGIKRVIQRLFGPIPVLPFVMTGATDMRYFRQLGIPAYGFFPVILHNDELIRMHSANERISIANVERGLAGTYGILRFLATLKQK